MDFSYSDIQTMLRETLSRYLTDAYTFDARQKSVRSANGWSPAVWQAFAQELGILGATFSEEQGGLGGGAVETMVIMEELGQRIVVEPYLSTIVIAGGLLKRCATPAADAVIGKIISGEARIAFAYAEKEGRYELAHVKTQARAQGDGYEISGHKAVVYGAPWATHLIVTARTSGGHKDKQGLALFLIDRNAKGIVTRDYPTVDGGRASEIFFENVSVPASAMLGGGVDVWPWLEAVADEATAALCAEAVGVLKQLHAQTLDYARQRKQFGKAIADFQVLQHRMVDMFMEVEQAQSMCLMATLKLGAPAKERALAVSAAKARIGKALRFVGQSAIQIHGGMGMTDELAVGHYFKRATMIESQFGSVDHHLQRYEDLSLAA
jgi:alkylation response protein AidB-like acyl-CoA dehydrogenase